MVQYAFDASGNVKTPTDEELTAIDSDTSIITYTSGTMADGRPFYAYVAVRPSRYREFDRKTTAKESLVLADYGEVLACGFEERPPAHVVQEMREQYGYDEHFLERLKEEVTRQRTAFSEQQEANRILDIVAKLKKAQPE